LGLLLFLIVVLCFSDRGVSKISEQVVKDAAASMAMTKFAEDLIDSYNHMAKQGAVTQEETDGADIVFRHRYCVMDTTFRMERRDETQWDLHTTLTEFVSVDTARSEEDAWKLEKHGTNNTYEVVTVLAQEDGTWCIKNGVSDVRNDATQRWHSEEVFPPVVALGTPIVEKMV
jgi:hypothetical protein